MFSKVKNFFNLPEAKNKNIALFYFLTLVNNSWFIGGNWIFFWTRYMTYGRLGVVDALAFGFGLLMEVPSGAISDLLGKRKTIILSSLLAAVGAFTIASGNNDSHILIGFLIIQAGWAFYSGSGEALAYDSLKENGKEEKFDGVISKSTVIALVGTVIANLIGAGLYKLNFRLPHYVWGLAYLIGFVAAFWMKEPKLDTVKFSLKNYLKQMSDGAKQLITPYLIPFVPIVFALLGIYYIYDFGLVQPAVGIHFGFLSTGLAVIYSILTIISALIVGLIPLMRKRLSDVKGLIILSLMLAIGTLLAALPLGYFGFFAMLLISLAGNLGSPWISVVVNRELPSEYRATALSTIALFSKIPYVIAAIIAGKMIEVNLFWLFNLVSSLLVGAAIVWTIVKFSSDKKLSFNKTD